MDIENVVGDRLMVGLKETYGIWSMWKCEYHITDDLATEHETGTHEQEPGDCTISF